MMIEQRPAPIGRYEVLQDFVCPDASVRVIRLAGSMERVEQHLHHNSMQIYVSLHGRVTICFDGEQKVLEPFDCLAVYPGTAHGAAPEGPEAIIANISFPPLGFDDQLPATPQPEPPDLTLPRGDGDVDD